ncbi:Spo0B domain-containing protein [Paenibacillus sp. y28]|uniref:Spo0B domain-containing protein n=1 Tax=Paenibacillus sp. y28 TaxID=3129110 RepID=UPI0030164C9C
MNNLKAADGIVIAVVIAGLAVLMLMSSQVWAAAAIALAVCLTIGVRLMQLKRQMAQRLAEQEAEATAQLLRTVNQQRHDMMNDIQLLSGYVQLKKYDKLGQVLDNIRQKAIRDSAVSRLNLPQFAAYFHSFPAKSSTLSLHVEIDERLEMSKLPLQAEVLSKLLIDVIELYHARLTTSGGEGTLQVSIGEEENGFRFLLCMHSDVKECMDEQVRELVLRTASVHQPKVESRWDEEREGVVIRLPFAS